MIRLEREVDTAEQTLLVRNTAVRNPGLPPANQTLLSVAVLFLDTQALACVTGTTPSRHQYLPTSSPDTHRIFNLNLR